MHGCDAARHVAIGHALKSGGFDHHGERILLWKFSNALDEILVGLSGAGRQSPEARDNFERVEIIEPIKKWNLAFRKFKTQETSAGAKHTISFTQCPVDVRDIANAERDCVGVERRASEWQIFSIAFDAGNALIKARVRDASLANGEHFGADVANHCACLRTAGSGIAQGDVARATGNVEKLEGLVGSRRIEPRDKITLPEPVQSTRHQIVHDVVALSHRGKNLIDEALPIAVRHIAKAKRCRRRRLGWCGGFEIKIGHRASIAEGHAGR